MSTRGRELVENGEQYENKKMKSIAVEEQEQEEGSKSESETRFRDLDQDTLLNVLQRVDAHTVGRAACVNKMWRNVARDDRLSTRNFSIFHDILGWPFCGVPVLIREGSETGFGDLKRDTLLNVLKRVDVVTLGRAACVNKQWHKVTWDNRIWRPIVDRIWASNGNLHRIDKRIDNRIDNYMIPFRKRVHPKDIWDYITAPPDFYSIDFSKKIRHLSYPKHIWDYRAAPLDF